MRALYHGRVTDSLAGKNILVTGANTGIGRVTAEVLAKRGAKVILACRSEEKTRPVLEAIRTAGGKADFLALDLADLDSVRAAAATWLAKGEPLHVLVNNAGLAGMRGATKQGFELTFGVNHLGTFLFTMLLLPRLRESKPARIVNVASKAHYDAKGISFAALQNTTRTVTGVPEYEVSKLCNVLFTRELAAGKAGDGVTSCSLHPGVIASDVWRQVPFPFRNIMKLFMLSVEEGAATTIHCATTPDLENGGYYDECKLKRPSKLAEDDALAKELWEKSESWTQ